MGRKRRYKDEERDVIAASLYTVVEANYLLKLWDFDADLKKLLDITSRNIEHVENDRVTILNMPVETEEQHKERRKAIDKGPLGKISLGTWWSTDALIKSTTRIVYAAMVVARMVNRLLIALGDKPLDFYKVVIEYDRYQQQGLDVPDQDWGQILQAARR